MRLKKLFLIKSLILLNFFGAQSLLADNHNIYETLELIQKDIKTLEKAVYSGSIELNNNTSTSSNFENNSEDVLTRHLLKLSEIENQFQQLTNKFEEINFKLDKLSNRLSKVRSTNTSEFVRLYILYFSRLYLLLLPLAIATLNPFPVFIVH